MAVQPLRRVRERSPGGGTMKLARIGRLADGRGRAARRPEPRAWRGPGPALRIASYNVHKCVGTDQRLDPARTAAVIGALDADIVALQETHERFGARAPRLDFERLASEHGLRPVRLGGGAEGWGWHGNSLLIRRGKVSTVTAIDLPGMEPRGALVVDLEIEASPLRVVAAHLGLLKHSRRQQAAAILAAIAQGSPCPTVLLGDLNEWRLGSRSSLRPLAPVFRTVDHCLPSFPSRFPVLPLDRILGSEPGLVRRVQVHDTPLSRVASDHLPVSAMVDLSIGSQSSNTAIAA